jgi:hypothetical protein
MNAVLTQYANDLRAAIPAATECATKYADEGNVTNAAYWKDVAENRLPNGSAMLDRISAVMP